MGIFQGYVTNLGAYNEGTLRGDWVDFPCSEEEFEEHLKKIGIGEPSENDPSNVYEEIFWSDWEDPFHIGVYEMFGEYASFDDVNELAERLDVLDEDSYDYLSMLRGEGYDIDESLDLIEDDAIHVITSDGTVWDDEGMHIAVGEYFAEDLSSTDMERYFNYKSFGRDYRLEYTPESYPRSLEEFLCGSESASDESCVMNYLFGGMSGYGMTSKGWEEYFEDLIGEDVMSCMDINKVQEVLQSDEDNLEEWLGSGLCDSTYYQENDISMDDLWELVRPYIKIKKLYSVLRNNYNDRDASPATAGEYWCDNEYASDYEIGVAVIQSIGFEGIDMESYFNYEAFGRDITLEGHFVLYKNNVYEIEA